MKISKKLLALVLIFSFILPYISPFMPVIEVKAETLLNEIVVRSDRTTVAPGELGGYEAYPDMEHIVIQEYGSNTNWCKWEIGYSSWHGFGQDVPTAVEDGTTHYALRLAVYVDSGYEISENPTIYLNGDDYTSVGYTRFDKIGDWGGYAYIDLGIAEYHYSVNIHDKFLGEAGTGYNPSDYASAIRFGNTSDLSLDPARIEVTADNEYIIPSFNNSLGMLSNDGEYENVGIFSAQPHEFLAPGHYETVVTLNYDVDDDGTYETELGSASLFFDVFDNYEPEPVFHINMDLNGGNSRGEEHIHQESVAIGLVLSKFNFIDAQEVTPPDGKRLEGFLINDVRYEIDDDFLLNQDIDVKYLWEDIPEEEFTVTFNSNGGTPIDNQVVVGGQKAVRPEDPEKDSLTFGGWYVDEYFMVQYDFNRQISESITLYARWGTPITVTVDVNGGNPIDPNVFEGLTGDTLEDILVPHAELLSHENPKMQVYGICDSATCENELDPRMPLEESVTVYLRWGEFHQVTFNLQQYGDDRDYTYVDVLDGDISERLESPERDGYEFIDWYEDSTCTTPFDFNDTHITEDTVIYAGWLQKIDDIVITMDAPVDGNTVSLNYNEQEHRDEPSNVPEVSTENPNFEIVNVAWVNGVCDEHSNACEELYSGTFEEDTYYYAFVEVHAKDGYCLTWDTLDNILINGEAPVEYFGIYDHVDTMFVARVKAVAGEVAEEFTIEFDANGGSGSMDPDHRHAGETYDIPGNEFTPPANMEFDKWEVSTGIGYKNPDESITITGNTVIKAIWREVETPQTTATLTFDVAGGNSIDPITRDIGENVELPTPERAGWDFIEWYKVDGEPGYLAGSNFELLEDTTLHARWERIELTATFDYNGGKVGDKTEATATFYHGDVIEEPTTDPVREGYEFAGWSKVEPVIDELTGQSDGPMYDFTNTETVDMTIYANWKKLYTVTYNTDYVIVDTNTVLVAAGDVPVSPIPEKVDYYKVSGYYLDAELTAPYDGLGITSDTTLYVAWDLDLEEIKEVNLTVVGPKVGTTTETEKDDDYWDWQSQTNIATMSVPNDANYTLYDEDYMYWVVGYEGEDFDTPFIGTFEKGKTYHADVYLEAKEGYKFAEDCVIKVNGEVAGSILNFIFDNRVLDLGIDIVPEEEVYTILDGANQTHETDSDGNITVRASGDFDKFVELRVDDEVVDPSNYTVTEGSTVVTLKAAYLNTLNNGNHTLKFIYNDGEVSTNFQVETKTTDNPQTFDSINIWIVLLILSFIGASSCIIKFKKNYLK